MTFASSLSNDAKNKKAHQKPLNEHHDCAQHLRRRDYNRKKGRYI